MKTSFYPSCARRKFIQRLSAGMTMSVLLDAFGHRQLLAQDLGSALMDPLVRLDAYMASVAAGEAAAHNLSVAAPALEKLLAGLDPTGSAVDKLALLRGIESFCGDPANRPGNADLEAIKHDVNQRLNLVSGAAGVLAVFLTDGVAASAAGYSSPISAALAATSSDWLDKLAKKDKERGWGIFKQSVKECVTLTSGEADRRIKANAGNLPNTTVEEVLRQKASNELPGVGKAKPRAEDMAAIPNATQRAYRDVKEGKVSTKEAAQQAAERNGRTAVREASRIAPRSEGEIKKLTPEEAATLKALQAAEDRRLFSFYSGEINGAAQVGSALIMLFGGTSQEAQKFASTVASVGNAVLTLVLGTGLGPLAIAGAVAGGLSAIVGLFQKDQSNQFFTQLAQAMKSLGAQLEQVQKNQILIIEGLQTIQEALANLTFENRQAFEQLRAQLEKATTKMINIYKQKDLDEFRSAGERFRRDLADSSRGDARKNDVINRLEACLTQARRISFQPHFTQGETGDTASSISFFKKSEAASVGFMVAHIGSIFARFGESLPFDAQRAAGRASTLPNPAVWRESVVEFMEVALSADGMKVISLEAAEIKSRAGALLPVYQDGRALRSALIVLSSPLLFEKAVAIMEELVGAGKNDPGAESASEILRKVAEDEKKGDYRSYVLRQDNEVWRSTVRNMKWTVDEKALFYEKENRLFTLRGESSFDVALKRKLIRVEKVGDPTMREDPGRLDLVDSLTDFNLNPPGGWKTMGCGVSVKEQKFRIIDKTNKTISFYVEGTMDLQWGFLFKQLSPGFADLTKTVKGSLRFIGGASDTLIPNQFVFYDIDATLNNCEKLLREDDRQRMIREVPGAFVKALGLGRGGTLLRQIEETGQMMNVMIAVANWRAVEGLTPDFPLWAATHSILCTSAGLEQFVRNEYSAPTSPPARSGLQSLLEAVTRPIDPVVTSFRKSYDADFAAARQAFGTTEADLSVAIVDQTLGALDTFLAGCGVPHDSFLDDAIV